MAGHSKWANIKFRKGAQDAKRGKIFTKLIREITVASMLGGDDVNANPRLRDAIQKANKANMKKDTVENAIKKGAGKLEGVSYSELRYEGYGPYGIAFLVECLTDNKNRSVAEVRHAFTKFGGNLGADGSVGYLFIKQGQIVLGSKVAEEDVFEIVMENGGDDLELMSDGSLLIKVQPSEFFSLKNKLLEQGFEPEYDSISYLPHDMIALQEQECETIDKLIEHLEDLDDVQHVYHNMAIED